MTKRYRISAFPAYQGDPVETNSYLKARWIYWWRGWKYPEVRLLDTKTLIEKVK